MSEINTNNSEEVKRLDPTSDEFQEELKKLRNIVEYEELQTRLVKARQDRFELNLRRAMITQRQENESSTKTKGDSK